MAKSNETGLFDDLDAFFSAAANAEDDSLSQADDAVSPRGRGGNVAPITRPEAIKPPALSRPVPIRPATAEHPAVEEGGRTDGAPEQASASSPTRSIAVAAPDSGPQGEGRFRIPWWAWLVAALAIYFMVVIWWPPSDITSLSRVTAKLGDQEYARVHSAMRQLMIRGDEQTIGKLFDIAASNENQIEERLRAIDTLAIIDNAEVDRALLRLQLSPEIHAVIRDAASSARKQRDAARVHSPGGR